MEQTREWGFGITQVISGQATFKTKRKKIVLLDSNPCHSHNIEYHYFDTRATSAFLLAVFY